MRLKFLHLIATLISSILCSGASSAAEFRPMCDLESRKNMGCTISLRGEIQDGDAQRLRQTLVSNLTKMGAFRFLLLDSRGGSVAEAMKIGEVVKSAMLTTTLVRLADLDNDAATKRQCISACFLVFIAGGERRLPNGALLGIHRPYFDAATYGAHTPLEIANGQEQLEEAVRKYSRANGVSDTLIARMMVHSSKQVYWLDQFDSFLLVITQQNWYQEIGIAACDWDPERSGRILAEAMKGIATSPIDEQWQRKAWACMADQIAKSQRMLAGRGN